MLCLSTLLFCWQLGHGSCHNHSKSMETPGSVSPHDAAVFSGIGMTLFSELGVALEYVHGLGLIVSKLDHSQAQEVETDPSNRITNFFKKSRADEMGKEENCSSVDEGSEKIALREMDISAADGVDDASVEGKPVIRHDSDEEGSISYSQKVSTTDARVESLPPQFQDAVEDSIVGAQFRLPKETTS